MEGEERRILQALKQALAGEQKAAALTVYADATPAAAEARLSRVLSGELALPARLLAYALRGPRPGPLLDTLADLASADWTPRRRDPAAVREEVRTELRDLGERIAGALQRLEDADLAELRGERRGPVRVRTSDRKGRAAG